MFQLIAELIELQTATFELCNKLNWIECKSFSKKKLLLVHNPANSTVLQCIRVLIELKSFMQIYLIFFSFKTIQRTSTQSYPRPKFVFADEFNVIWIDYEGTCAIIKRKEKWVEKHCIKSHFAICYHHNCCLLNRFLSGEQVQTTSEQRTRPC